MKIIIFFVVVFGIALLIKVLSNLKFRKNNTNINSENFSINSEFSDDDIPLNQALRNFNHFK